jgi:hypothetical protein
VRRLLVIAAVVVSGCGGGASTQSAATAPGRGAPLPTRAPSVGPGPRHRPLSLGRRAARAQPIRGLRCAPDKRHPARYGVHLELFAAARVVLIPPGIGIAPPRSRSGAYVSGGRCSYPLRTREPTGVVEVSATGLTLGNLFAVWGQPLSRRRMARFHGRVRAYLDGRPWPGAPGAIPLRRHAQIVLEVGTHVRPHSKYRFRPGL